MVLRKDIQVVAWLIMKRIEFNTAIKTVYVDESKLSDEMIFRLREHETEPERIKRLPYKKREPKVKEKKIEKPKEKKISLPKKKPTKKQIILHKKQHIDFSKISIASQSIYELPKNYQRPKAEYSNKQWEDYEQIYGS